MDFPVLDIFLFRCTRIGHLSNSPFFGSIRYIFGIFSAIFMTSTFIFLYMKIYKRKTISNPMSLIPFIIAFIFPFLFIYMNFSGTKIEIIKDILSKIENIVWITGSSITIYTTYMLGTNQSEVLLIFSCYSNSQLFLLFYGNSLVSWKPRLPDPVFHT